MLPTSAVLPAASTAQPRAGVRSPLALLVAMLALLVASAGFIGVRQATAAPRSEQALAAAAWLEASLTEDDVMPGFGRGGDIGLTIDALWALIAAGAPQADIDRVARGIEANAVDYATYDRWDPESQHVIGGAAGKVLLAISSIGADPTDFAGRDWVEMVRGTVTEEGRVVDTEQGEHTSTPANMFGQSLVMMALARNGGMPEETVTFLLRQQCSDGYFRIFFNDDATCDTGANGEPVQPDRDATAMAVMALLAAEEQGIAEARPAIDKAIAWLLADQSDEGGFGGGFGTEAVNTNSTGLVAVVLAAEGETDAADAAQAFVAARQLTAENAGQAHDDLGAIAYDDAGLELARAEGIRRNYQDQFRRATAQAIFALAPVSLHAIGRVETPAPTTPAPTTPAPSAPAPTTPDPSPPAPTSTPTTPAPSGSTSPSDSGTATASAAPTSRPTALPETGGSAAAGVSVALLLGAGATLALRRRR
ncbi:hypothetical protein [Parenemella sanctibonifatiensis]|uniref:Cell wall anchor protein n=1 Tax=Parenemella sanctibonifatiensis TaxID=2016505 RepID=A0A255DZH2_9ACTN|nr:hypothetical protein [Parenemella sanctibonifatiensis]OYN84717.1 cell wall anchor protein [Parenemella sanctibonifatiensis]